MPPQSGLPVCATPGGHGGIAPFATYFPISLATDPWGTSGQGWTRAEREPGHIAHRVLGARGMTG